MQSLGPGQECSESGIEAMGPGSETDTESSFHIQDPNGYDLQISGKDMKPV